MAGHCWGRAIAAILAAAMLTLAGAGAVAQQATAPDDPRAATGGAQTLEDIMRRQRGEAVGNGFRRDGDGAAPSPMGAQGLLGTRGGASDAEVWRALRFGEAATVASTGRPVDRILVQDSGMAWLQLREGRLAIWGAYAMGGMLALIALFHLLRGRIRIDGGRSGVTVRRFGEVERFGHWLLATSFILLALTGLALLFGRMALIPIVGKEAFATVAGAGKWIHNNVSWAFMAALILVFLTWVLHNIPNRHDLKWLAMGGGFFGGGHPPSRKFNAGQKLIFWAVVLLGASVSASGLSLLFPFDLPMFAATFEKVNLVGGWLGLSPDLPTRLQPHQEMQLAQLWHTIVALAMIVIILAHIYIGTIGMEGGFEAMGSGEVDRNWAEEHHNLWVRELEEKGRLAPSDATPAE